MGKSTLWRMTIETVTGGLLIAVPIAYGAWSIWLIALGLLLLV